LDTQIKKILNTTATALKKVVLSKKPRADKGRPQIRDEEFLEVFPMLKLFDKAKSSTTPSCGD